MRDRLVIHEKSLSSTDKECKKVYHNRQTTVLPTTFGFYVIGKECQVRSHSHISGILSTAKGDVPK
ncbi:hypothetical protein [Porphyromonas cangingivalis]|nr:hypothetical protein [Porphyromonas cangingivalis]